MVSDIYKVNFYGPETSSVLHQNGTDRLWVRWLLQSKLVRERLTGEPSGRQANENARMETLDALRLLAPLVRLIPAGNRDGPI